MTKSPARSRKKKRTPAQECSDEMVKMIVDGKIDPTPERISISKAMYLVEAYERRNIEGINEELSCALKNVKEKVLSLIIDEIIESEHLRLSDTMAILELISLEYCTIPLWESQHLDEIDDCFAEHMLDAEDDVEDEEVNEEEKPFSAKNIFAGIRDKSPVGDGDE